MCSEKRTFFLVNHRGAQHAPVLWPPFTFGCKQQSGFKLPTHARVNPMAAVVGDEEVSLPGELLRAQYAVVFSQILASWPMAAICPRLG